MVVFTLFGNALSAFFIYLGQVAQLAAETFRSIFSGRIRLKLTLFQLAEIGYRSQLVVIVTGLLRERSLRLRLISNFGASAWKPPWDPW